MIGHKDRNKQVFGYGLKCPGPWTRNDWFPCLMVWDLGPIAREAQEKVLVKRLIRY